MSILLEMFIK